MRAVSPDIVSLSTNSKKNSGKGKGQNGKMEEEQQQQQQEDSVVLNNNVSLKIIAFNVLVSFSHKLLARFNLLKTFGEFFFVIWWCILRCDLVLF